MSLQVVGSNERLPTARMGAHMRSLGNTTPERVNTNINNAIDNIYFLDIIHGTCIIPMIIHYKFVMICTT